MSQTEMDMSQTEMDMSPIRPAKNAGLSEKSY